MWMGNEEECDGVGVGSKVTKMGWRWRNCYGDMVGMGTISCPHAGLKSGN